MSLSGDEIAALITVVETGSFRAAALKLHRSQSSISYTIKNIETNLKIEIFERIGTGVNLTDAGKIIYNKALAIMQINGEISAFSSSIKSGIETKIKLVISAVTPTEILMHILREFNLQFPQTKIELNFKTFEEPIEMLLSGEADIVISSGQNPNSDLERFRWNSIDFVPVTSPNHAATNPLLSEAELYNITFLVVGGKSTLMKKSSGAVVENANVWNVTDFLIKKELLLNGLGWGFMPKQLIAKELEAKTLVKVPVQESVPKQLDLLRKKSAYHGKASQCLWELFILYSNNLNFAPSISQHTWQSDPLQY